MTMTELSIAGRKEELITDERSKLIDQPCILLNPQHRGRIGIPRFIAFRGMIMKGGITVPHGEYRLATQEELDAWDNR